MFVKASVVIANWHVSFLLNDLTLLFPLPLALAWLFSCFDDPFSTSHKRCPNGGLPRAARAPCRRSLLSEKSGKLNAFRVLLRIFTLLEFHQKKKTFNATWEIVASKKKNKTTALTCYWRSSNNFCNSISIYSIAFYSFYSYYSAMYLIPKTSPDETHK